MTNAVFELRTVRLLMGTNTQIAMTPWRKSQREPWAESRQPVLLHIVLSLPSDFVMTSMMKSKNSQKESCMRQ